MLKTSDSIEFISRPKKGRVGVGGNDGNDGDHDNEYSPQSSE